MIESNGEQLFYYNSENNASRVWEDMWETYRTAMGNGFLTALYAPAPMKDYIEGQSRLEHGKVVLVTNARQASRDVTLAFNIHGDTEKAMYDNRDKFYALLYKGKVTLRVTHKESGREDTFNLIYKKSSSYTQGYSRRVCVVTVKFEEPNPTNRAI